MTITRRALLVLAFVGAAALAANYGVLRDRTVGPSASSGGPLKIASAGKEGGGTLSRGKPIKPGITVGEAARFLNQATFGATEAEAMALTNSSYAAWLDTQFTRPRTSHYTHVLNLQSMGVDIDDFSNQHAVESFWKQAITGPDQLRQRVTWGLSQVFVVGDVGNVRNAAYYDVLAANAFGNYRDLLEQVTLSPAMGFWLSHIGNRKEDLATGRLPDENYAREVMQLFSIGLWKLNPDGTRQLDAQGRPIPTYSQQDIRGMAKVLTGWTYANCNPATESWYCFDSARSGYYRNYTDITAQMLPLEAYHSTSEKAIVNGVVIPAGGTARSDLKIALDTLYNHPNVGPFFGRQMIQRLVKSNPSPGYVGRVAAAFANNGSGVRGDLRAVIRAVLLDPEARDVAQTQTQAAGRLREPVQSLAQYFRVFTTPPSDGRYDFNVWWMEAVFQQRPLSSPSVFNFYSPNFLPPGEMSQNGVFGPEYQILHEGTVVDAYNFIEYFAMNEVDGATGYRHNYAPFESLAGNPGALVDKLSLVLTGSRLSTASRAIIVDAVGKVSSSQPKDRVKMALMLFQIAPDYKVQK
jgi:uncharacterized protein (DUF1800 family)